MSPPPARVRHPLRGIVLMIVVTGVWMALRRWMPVEPLEA